MRHHLRLSILCLFTFAGLGWDAALKAQGTQGIGLSELDSRQQFQAEPPQAAGAQNDATQAAASGSNGADVSGANGSSGANSGASGASGGGGMDLNQILILGAIVVLILVMVMVVYVLQKMLGTQPSGDQLQANSAQIAREQLKIMLEQLERTRDSLNQQLIRNQDVADSRFKESAEVVDRRVAMLNDQVNKRLREVVRHLQRQLTENRMQAAESTRDVMDRLESSGKLFAEITGQFGELRESGKKIESLGEDVGKLHKILAPPMGKGRFGEQMLEVLMRNVLPSDSYDFQYQFKSGEQVDAVIKLPEGMVSVDSKFPMATFSQFISANDQESRKKNHKKFVDAARSHIDAIANKYIKPDEGTFDFAMMYIPAENIYYETIIIREEFGRMSALSEYAATKRVFCVGPNTLLAYLQTILIGLRGLQIEENVKELVMGLSEIEEGVKAFSNDFRIMGNHLRNADKKMDDAQKKLAHLKDRVRQVTLSASHVDVEDEEMEENMEEGMDEGMDQAEEVTEDAMD